jgi:hypothetical protein
MARPQCDWHTPFSFLFVAEGKFAGYVSASIWCYTEDMIKLQKSGKLSSAYALFYFWRENHISNEHLLSWKYILIAQKK